MSKSLYIAEKPSVAKEFAKALNEPMSTHKGYLESDRSVVTWCLGHLITMSYPEAYDPKYKKWSLSTLPFIPEEYKYEVIPGVKDQYETVAGLLNRPDVETIYVCTDSGREGEYIYRLVEQMAGVKGKNRRRVWIDSQTEEEILRGIREAKDLSAYDSLADSAYLRAKEDYLMGINFSRVLTLKYGSLIASFLHRRYSVVSVGRVMTCVLGMVVRREREIRGFVRTPFYRVLNTMNLHGAEIEGEWRAAEGSLYFQSPKLYKENGFKKREDAEELVRTLSSGQPLQATVSEVHRKKETKNPPLLYNLAELQNDCSRIFKISPDETLSIVQELYEKKMVTYPRTDARVLSTAAAKEIARNLRGLAQIAAVRGYAEEILAGSAWKNISKTRYVNDKLITDHYALVPTGQGIGSLRSLKRTEAGVYELIVRRFLAIFYPPAVYRKVSLTAKMQAETFQASAKVLEDPGYLAVMKYSFRNEKTPEKSGKAPDSSGSPAPEKDLISRLMKLKKGSVLPVAGLRIKEGEASPPKRYNSGSMILAMENAGQLIEDEELREQIRGSGIGTSATRADILKKLVKNQYLNLNKKTQVITPTLQGEMIYDAVNASIRPLLNPELTASWEKGLSYVAEGSITPDEYMEKLETFIRTKTEAVKSLNNQSALEADFRKDASFYRKKE